MKAQRHTKSTKPKWPKETTGSRVAAETRTRMNKLRATRKNRSIDFNELLATMDKSVLLAYIDLLQMQLDSAEAEVTETIAKLSATEVKLERMRSQQPDI